MGEHEIKEVSCSELKKMIDSNVDFTLLDVRNPEEFEVCNIKKSILVPFSEIEEHLDDFNKDEEYVVHCKLGGKSTEAVQMMLDKGFHNVKLLSGGLLKWSAEIEPDMKTF